MKNASILYLLLFISITYSCSIHKFIPQGEKLYDGAEITLKSEDTINHIHKIKEELETVIHPKPNTTLLGIRPGLYFFYKTQKQKPGFIYKFLNKKFGEKPVYLSNINKEKSKELLDNRLKNRGFFKNEISYKITDNNKTARIEYAIITKKPYTLKTYQIDSMPFAIQRDIKETMNKSLIKKGDRFDLSLFKIERERIDRKLKSKGYYNFNADFLIFEADTNRYKNKKFDLFLRLKKEVPKKSIVPYSINSINVYPNYSLETEGVIKDTIVHNDTKFIQDTVFFKPKRLSPHILFKKGQLYNPKTSKLTSNRLSSIGTYKFVTIRYKEIDSINDGITPKKIDANVYLSPLNKRALRLELQGVSKSNSFIGPTLLARYSNRNLFKGGETFNLTTTAGYETQIVSGENAGLSSIQLGVKGDLIFPRVLFPVNIGNDFKYAIPNTKISIGGEFLDRSKLYSLFSVNTSFGYNWKANRFVYHELNPININYVNLSNTTQEFDAILKENPFLSNSFQQKFIAGLTYTFIYNELNDNSIKKPIFFNTNIDIAGNTLSIFDKNNSEEPNTFLGLEYAQYAKVDVDFRYHLKIGKDQRIVTRLFAGLGLPYGNSETLPFSKQYFSGGPYSVRAFKSRSLGPGSYVPKNNDTGEFFDRVGDIRLEANIEYRFPLFSYFKGAVFADAGNIWLTKENEALRNGTFSSDFISELGVGTGAGIRVDIQNFVIRFDAAIPIRKPFLPKGERFDFNLKKPAYNFAIGYPF
ncbi:BamA/TamA family outer membrane protein [Aquimarina muelleri]|uniref:translocation and assembly module lipoprotein TamL n=1 Tax=Aquimarina muelleri TaxID=279356 RepID=UPI00047F694A|nr:BamA/TamA family outer membrane protein [Aquimarina muelleri]MCX2763490.1 BamA/TamA family outer membrane protein [Aquimarina muelleri]